MLFNAERNIHLLDDLQLPYELKIELAKQVSLAMQSFVDRAFGIDPVQTCLWKTPRIAAVPDSDTLDSAGSMTSTFNSATME